MILPLPENQSYECPKKFKHVYQFKITLKHIRPPIWRRIQVPEIYSFWDLHIAIVDCMPWADYHLHSFTIRHPTLMLTEEIGIPDDDFEDEFKIVPGWKLDIAPYFTFKNSTAKYLYDYGDSWEHTIKLEKIFPREKGVAYPRCIGGRRACPPEDCGGTGGYGDLLETLSNPQSKQYKEMLEWVGGSFDPEAFSPEQVRFDDPDRRWQYAFGAEPQVPDIRLLE